MPRNRLSEIAAVQGRSRSGPWRARSAIEELKRQWEGGSDPTAPPSEFVVIRLVTALEVFSRDWVREIVNAGEPYIGRAADLVKGTLKVDFVVAQALVGKLVTFGDLVAHEISLSGVDDLDRVFSRLVGESLFHHLADVVDRFKVEIEGAPPVRMLMDPKETRAQLARLFELRHILVHELPDELDIMPAQVTGFVEQASLFCGAAEQAFSTLIHGDYPLTQFDMNRQAGEQAGEAERELQAMLERVDGDRSDEAFAASQLAWEVYRTRQAEYRSRINDPMPGSIAPLLFSSEFEKVTRARIEEFRWYLERAEGDL